MQTKKFNLDDFEAVTVEELLHTKGGAYTETEPVGGPCAGDPNGFGGYNDANEVVVTSGTCITCDNSMAYSDEQTFVNWGLRVAHSLGFHNQYESPCGESGGSPVNKPPYDPFAPYAL